MAADGLVSISSSFGPRETVDRLEAEGYGQFLPLFDKK